MSLFADYIPAQPFSDSIIYKITANTFNPKQVFVGMTRKKNLVEILRKFRKDAAINTKYEKFKYPGAKIEIIEQYPYNNYKELFNRKLYWIKQTPNCIN